MASACIDIRRASVRDLPSLVRFGAALAAIHVRIDPRRFTAPEDAAFHRFFEVELERPETAILIAEIDSTPVGYAFVRNEPGNLVLELRETGTWLHDIFVAPEARARGVGSRLMDACIAVARERGSSSLMLGVSPHNAPARALFERQGFRPTMVEMRVELNTTHHDGTKSHEVP